MGPCSVIKTSSEKFYQTPLYLVLFLQIAFTRKLLSGMARVNFQSHKIAQSEIIFISVFYQTTSTSRILEPIPHGFIFSYL